MNAAQRKVYREVFGHSCPLDEERNWLRDYGCYRRGIVAGLSGFTVEMYRRWDGARR